MPAHTSKGTSNDASDDTSAHTSAGTPDSPRDLVDRFLAATTGDDPGDLADFYAPHVVIEMPFATPGLYPARIETTREELRARFSAGAAVRRYDSIGDVRVHVTADPEVVITEYELTGRMLATGEPFTLAFAMFLTIRDGRIVHTRDYTDPVAGAKALGRLPALLAALSDTAGDAPDGAPDAQPDAKDAPGQPLSPADRTEITELIALHGHFTDTGQLDRMAEVFVDDVTYDLTGIDPKYGTLHGLSALREAALALGADNPVGHHVTNTVLTALADGRVTARSKGIGIMANGTCGSVSYEDTVTRGPRGWRITHRYIRAHRAPLGAG